MTKAKVLLDQQLAISERYRVELKVYEVKLNKKYPDGIKVSLVLIDVERNIPRLLIDNHAPFGFHAHLELPESRERRLLQVKNYTEALEEFWYLVKEITDE